MKFRYKVLIVLAVFIAALFFFSEDITETFFSTSASTVNMSDATLPTVTIDVNGCEINCLHGYISNLDEMIMRESITPVMSDRTFTVLIHENESNVKKLKYEILNSDGREVESDSFTVLDVESGPKKVRIALKETMKSGQEYVAKITLITNESKRIYYYTRLKMYDDGHLFDKLDFVQNFHDTLIHGSESEKDGLKKYLESTKASDNSSFANVTIKSSFSLVTWGELKPEVIWEEAPTVTEFYDSMASVELKFLVSIETENGTEFYLTREDFRLNYTSTRTYLYTYNRTMEAVFDVANTSIMKDEFKLGITGSIAQTAASGSGEYIAFAYGRELYVYEPAKNVLTEAFTFRQNNGDYSRDYYDQHDLKLIFVHDNGNVDFAVYGYMNRGEYEGRVGIVLYRYIGEEKRVEEQLYIPINSSYQLLAADMTDFAYLGERDIFYFSLYDAIYSYNLTTKTLEVIAEDVPEEHIVYCEEESFLAWQEASDDLEARSIYVLDLLTGDIRSVKAGEGECIRLYGRINNNIIYGFMRESDVCIFADGSLQIPSYRLCIENGTGQVLKSYQEPGLYIDSVEIGDNILVLKRLRKKDSTAMTEYESVADDSILNRLVEVVHPVSMSKRVTDRILTEYYISLPSGVDITEIPTLVKARNTVINFDTTVRVAEPEDRTSLYYAYSFGRIAFADPSPAKVIAAADSGTGTVIDKDGRVVWERGVKAARSEISGITTVDTAEGYSSLQAAMRMLLLYRNYNADTSDFDYTDTSIYDRLAVSMKSSVLNLTGATLDEVLYYVYKSRPVLAIRPDGSACVITGYDATSVTVYEPAKKKSVKYNIKEATTMFEDAGSIFVSYVD